MPEVQERQASRSILYLEDDDTAAYLFDLTVRECPDGNATVQVYRVVTTGEALAFLFHQGSYNRAPCPDVVVLDINVPGGATGFAVLKAIRNDPALARLPVVMFSSSAAREDRDQATKLGADEYLIKSGLAAFSAVVQTALRLAR